MGARKFMETGCISPPGVWDGEVANGQNSFALDQWVDAKWKVNRRSSWWVAGETNNGAQSLELRRSCSASWVFPSSSYPVRNRSLLKERRSRESSESGYFRGERSPDVKLFLPVPLPSTSSQFSRAIRSISRTLFQIFALVSLISDLMFFFLVSCVSFLLLLNSMSLPPLPPWTRQTRILSLPTCRDFLAFLPIHFAAAVSSSPSDNPDPGARISILDLPDLAMEIILSKLPPAGLCTMAAVCSSMREKCRSNHLWGTHLEKKWGSLMGSSAAQTAWKSFLSSNQGIEVSGCHRSRWLGALTSKLNLYDTTRPLFFDNSNMSKYLAIETGKFSFPAQVFNRENGHLGFVLSCYDAELKYDYCTDTFTARYLPHGTRAAMVEEGVSWERVRAPQVETLAHDLHDSSCLSELRPGNHVEVQWRRSKEFPYGWWYGVVGHLDSCGGGGLHCRCQSSDDVVLEFKQYSEGSRWRRAVLRRKSHREEGNGLEGFYGGVRRIRRNGEIAAWWRLWPTAVLD